MKDRTIGYILLIAGIATMCFGAYQIINVFTGKAQPIEVFTYQQKEGSPSQFGAILKQYQTLTGSGNSVIPGMGFTDPTYINKVVNLTIYYFIMQFVLGFGYRIASLGVQLIRPINVRVHNKTLESISEEEEKRSL